MSNTKLIKNSGIYIIVSILQKAIMFFLLPLYTAYLSPDDYGILSVITSIISFLSVFFLLSLHGAASRFHYINTDSEIEKKTIWGTLSLFVLINSIVLGCIFIIFHKYLIIPFAKGINFYPLLLLGILTTIISPLYLFFQTYLQTIQNGFYYGLNTIINFLLNVGLVILFVVFLEKGVLGILLANFITAFLFFIYVIFAFLPKLSLSIKKKVLVSAFRYSIPLIPHSLSGWIMNMIDRILINNFTGKAETGLYSVGYQFGNIVNVFTTAVNQAYVPWFFENEKLGKDGTNRIVKIAELLTVVYCFGALIISFFSFEVLKIMVTESFRTAWIFIPFISFAYVFNGLYYFFINVLFLEKTKWIPLVTFSSAFIGVIFNLILIPKYGGIGAAISMLISFVLSSILALLFSQYVNKSIQFKWIKMYFYVLLFFVISVLIYIIPISFSSISLAIIKLLIILIIFFLFYFKYKKEIVLLYKLLIQK